MECEIPVWIYKGASASQSAIPGFHKFHRFPSFSQLKTDSPSQNFVTINNTKFLDIAL
jgi:hypothetical protein